MQLSILNSSDIVFKHYSFSAMVCGTRTTPKRKTPLITVMSPRMKTKQQWWYQQRQKRRVRLLVLWNSTWEVRRTLNPHSMCTCANLNSAHTSDARAPAAAPTSHATHPNTPREVRGLISGLTLLYVILALCWVQKDLFLMKHPFTSLWHF